MAMGLRSHGHFIQVKNVILGPRMQVGRGASRKPHGPAKIPWPYVFSPTFLGPMSPGLRRLTLRHGPDRAV
jgi:hypothetical protein